jgi:hypothetical protein
MVSQSQLQETLTIVFYHIMPGCAQIEYRLVGTAAALLQGVSLPTGDVDILVKERQSVDVLGSALASFTCLQSPAWIPEAGQYYAEYEINGVGVGISTVEAETDSDGIECLGRGPWEHYVLVSCGPFDIPAVGLELRLVSELLRNRPDRYTPLIQHMQVNGCDIGLVRRGMEARSLPQGLQDKMLCQLNGTPAGQTD